MRFTEQQRAELLAIGWWEWPEKTILERVAALNGGGIEEFLDRTGCRRPERANSRLSVPATR